MPCRCSDECGTAIFDNLIRGEFHFDPVSNMARVRTWCDEGGFPDPAVVLILDRTGELSTHELKPRAALLRTMDERFAGWLHVNPNRES